MIKAKFIDRIGFDKIIAMPIKDREQLPSYWWIVVPCPQQRRFIRGGPTAEAWKELPKIKFALKWEGNDYSMPVYEETDDNSKD